MKGKTASVVVEYQLDSMSHTAGIVEICSNKADARMLKATLNLNNRDRSVEYGVVHNVPVREEANAKKA